MQEIKLLSIVIPTYNESETIHLILDKVRDVQLVNNTDTGGQDGENDDPLFSDRLTNDEDDKECLMKRIDSVPYYPNVNFKKKGNNFVLAGAIGGITGADIDGDGKKGEFEDVLLSGLLGGLVLNSLNPDRPGLYLKKETQILIQP